MDGSLYFKRFALLLTPLFLLFHLSGCAQLQQQVPAAIPEAGPITPPSGQIPSGPTPAELEKIGQRIFLNEAGGSISNLVHWNVGEDFASMGIGHFTWYPAGREQRFGNAFPHLISFMQANGSKPPSWVQIAVSRGAPWYTREQLLRVKNTAQIKELEQYLYNTRGLQAAYIVQRAKSAMPRFVETTAAELKQRVVQNINALANTPGGWYPLVDYVNFKGEGFNRNGGYNGQNWGMLQVLESMAPSQPGSMALNAFADAAYGVLVRRVQNSPPQNNEAKWLPGWRNRIDTYRSPLSV